MPIYEYECEKCGHLTEAWQKFSDPPLEKCDRCGGKVKKLISQSTFHLKGTGWYVTDYASKSGRSQSKPEKVNKQGASSNEKKAEKNTKKSDD